MCQGCVDKGYLAQPTYDAIEAFVLAYPQAEFGPAHIVLADDNVDNGNIQESLKFTHAVLSGDMTGCNDWQQRLIQSGAYIDNNPDELAATCVFLEYLLTIPEDDR